MAFSNLSDVSEVESKRREDGRWRVVMHKHFEHNPSVMGIGEHSDFQTAHDKAFAELKAQLAALGFEVA